MLGKHVVRVGGERRLELSEHLAFWCVPVLSHVTERGLFPIVVFLVPVTFQAGEKEGTSQ